MPTTMDSLETLRDAEPRELYAPTFYAADFTRESIQAQTKLPVLIHGENVYVDDDGIWYARTQARADRLWRLMGPRNAGLNAFRLLPLQSAEVYAREAIRLLGAGRVLFKVEYAPEDTATPPGATP